MRHLFRSVGVAAAALALVVCHPNGPKPGSNSQEAVVQVVNQSLYNVDVTVLAAGARKRLGIAPPNATRTFTIPAYLVSVGQQMRFIAVPQGSPQQPVTDAVVVNPGEMVSLTIPPG